MDVGEEEHSWGRMVREDVVEEEHSLGRKAREDVAEVFELLFLGRCWCSP